MTQVRFDFTEDRKSLILTVKGHAGADEPGKDTICSAATILAYTLAQVVKTMREEDKLRKEPTIRLDPGDCCIVCKPKRQYYDEVLIVYSVIQSGYNLLAHNFPDNVSVKLFGNA